MTQKYFKGDHVFIGNMPKNMSHFPNNCGAIVLYSYSETPFPSLTRHDKMYAVYILPDRGETSWYTEDQSRY
jgi:hypothetical protein